VNLKELWAKWRGKRLKPGQKCHVSGQYTWSQYPHGQATCVKGEPMPPPARGHPGYGTGPSGYWRLSDPSRHKE
jgi:hypothetical protein